MSENHENLRCEYAEVACGMRHYGSLQFSQLTVFVASVGGLSLIDLSGSQIGIKLAVVVLVALVGLSFVAMSVRISDYWDKLVGRAKKIESELGMDSFGNAPPVRLLRNRDAVLLAYVALTGFALATPFLKG